MNRTARLALASASLAAAAFTSGCAVIPGLGAEPLSPSHAAESDVAERNFEYAEQSWTNLSEIGINPLQEMIQGAYGRYPKIDFSADFNLPDEAIHRAEGVIPEGWTEEDVAAASTWGATEAFSLYVDTPFASLNGPTEAEAQKWLATFEPVLDPRVTEEVMATGPELYSLGMYDDLEQKTDTPGLFDELRMVEDGQTPRFRKITLDVTETTLFDDGMVFTLEGDLHRNHQFGDGPLFPNPERIQLEMTYGVSRLDGEFKLTPVQVQLSGDTGDMLVKQAKGEL